jgi:hypothetical protein
MSDNNSNDICKTINFDEDTVYDELVNHKREHFTQPIKEEPIEDSDYSWVYVVIGIIVTLVIVFFVLNTTN